jgi:beta-xylosidase
VNRLNPAGALAAVLVLALGAGCGDGRPAPPAATGSASGSPADTFTNPVYRENFPDPGLLEDDGIWYAYGTNGNGVNVPMLTSTDLVTWEAAGDALPAVGRWATAGNTWAPEVVRTSAGRYLLYYTARSTNVDLQCIGAAVADNPRGPFVDPAGKPLICQAGEGGSIDAGPYVHSDGRLYLYWKNDGNHIGAPTHLYGQALAGDGLSLTGPRVRLLTNTEPWQGQVIEAPQLVRHDDRLYLFYSANAFDSDAYAVGYATCATPLGRCRDAVENPILTSSPAAAGPGHSYLVTKGGGTWLLYHAWPPDAIGSVSPGRQLWLDRVDWVDGKPAVRGPTAQPQPRP